MSASLEVMDANYEPLLARGMTCSVTGRNSGAGVIGISYPLDGPRASGLGAGRLVRARVTSGDKSVELAPYVLLTHRVDHAEKPPVGEWSGVQHGWESMRKSSSRPNLLFGSGEDSFFGNPGYIFGGRANQTYRGVVGEAHDRSSLLHMGVAADEGADSDGMPWLDEGRTITYPLRVPWTATVAELLNMFTDDGDVEWTLSATGRAGDFNSTRWSWLHLFNPGGMGRDLTSVRRGGKPTIFETGVNCRAAPKTVDAGESPVRRVLAYNEPPGADYAIAEDTTVTDDLDMPEATIYLPDVKSVTVLARQAARELSRLSRVFTEQTLDLDLGSDVPVPGIGVGAGDWVWLRVGGAPMARRRVAAWSVSLGASGEVSGSLVLDTLIRSRAQRVHADLARLDRSVRLGPS